MTFEEYSVKVEETVKYQGTPKECLTYASIALGGEVGEYLNEYKKWLRTPRLPIDTPQGAERQRMLLELGDMLWYLSRVAYELGSSIGNVAQMNVDKLRARYSK